MIATTARSRVVRQPEPTPQAQDDPKWFLVAQGSPMPRCRFWSDYATRKQGCAGAKPIPGDNGLSSSDPLQLVRKQLNYSKLTLMGRDARVRAGRPRPALLPTNQVADAGEPARGPAADEGVRPTSHAGLCWGQRYAA